MKVLVACEFSGTLREAFKRMGCDAWSCDLLPSEVPGQHIQGDVLECLDENWDLMVAHPPCTYLSYAGNRYWERQGRSSQRIEALEFSLKLWKAPIKKIALENPVGLINRVIGKPAQIIHPFYFGDRDLKRTCLWLKGLPPLYYQIQSDLIGERTASAIPEPIYRDKSGKKRFFTEAHSSQKERSRTFRAVAEAMAEQWSQP